jgi:protein ImuB
VRIAFVRVADFPLAAWTRLDPSLALRPFVVVDAPHVPGAGSLPSAHGVARVLAVTGPARALGVLPGQTGYQARAVAPDVYVRGVSDEAVRGARSALVDAVATVGARIEQAREGLWVEVGDLVRVYPSEAAAVGALGVAVRRVGLRASVGVASNKAVAAVAARRGASCIVRAGEEAAFLAPLPLEVLPLSDGLRADLYRLGITTLGQLARLPLEATGLRLGEEATRAVRVAQGGEGRPLVPEVLPTRFEEALGLDDAVENIEPLLFGIRRLLEALVTRLAGRSLAVGALELELSLPQGLRDARSVAVGAPTRDVASLVKFVRGSLEAHPPVGAVSGLRVVAVPRGVRGVQGGLFEPPGPAPERLALTLTRLAALVGEDRVGAPVAPDTHRPYAVSMAAFDPPRTPRTPLVSATTPGQPLLALHVFRPPREATVSLDGGRLVRVEAGDVSGAVRACGGPWRVAGDWWDASFEHEGYDVELDDGGVYLVAYDRARACWQLDGVYA